MARAFAVAGSGLALLTSWPTAAFATQTSISPGDLDRLSIEDLAKIQVSSVSKTDQPLSEAAASIFVITRDDILRSGALSLPEMLRLAPNLQVAEVAGAAYAVSARGFNSGAADKLLVLIDGRSVYTPFLNGVYWDVQRVPPEDIDRIEVISGPGAALWGANAVNGVINIVTRGAGETVGGVIEGGGGSLDQHVDGQFGAQLRPDLAVRLYGLGAWRGSDLAAAGASGQDAYSTSQGGVRLDWTPGRDRLTLQGDLYRGGVDHSISPREAFGGQNLVLRWTREGAQGSTFQVQAYYDDLWRHIPTVASDELTTYDIDIQHSFALGGRQQIVWGGGVRAETDDFPVSPGNVTTPLTQFFRPTRRTLVIGDLFGQDTIALASGVSLVLGLKLENDAYVGVTPLPDVRLSWKPNDAGLFWAAVSRATRAPSRLDRDFYESLGALKVLVGGDFKSEDLIAYEVGYRAQPTARLSASISLFYNDYRNLRTVEYSPGGVLPGSIQNQMEGSTYGVEAWGSFQALDWWRLSAGVSGLHKDLRFKPGSAGLGGLAIAGDDPDWQASLRSSMDLPHGLSLDMDLRGVGALPAPASPAYAELNARLAWALTRSLELSVAGANLLHERHLEFGTTAAPLQIGASGLESARSVVAAAKLRF
jgi:iron complex outermembrane receptor protein